MRISFGALGYAERFFLLTSGTVGLLLAFLTPPFQVADEPTHLFRAYEVSEGVTR